MLTAEDEEFLQDINADYDNKFIFDSVVNSRVDFYRDAQETILK